MRIRRTLVVAVGVGSLTVLAAGCGGSSKPSTISGGPVAQTTSATPTAPSPAKPVFRFPSDVTINLDISPTGDPVKDAVAQDAGYAITTMEEASTGPGAADPHFPKFFTGQALAEETSQIAQYLKAGKVITGTTRYYDFVPTVTDATHAGITFCGDETKGYDKIAKTGKVLVTTPSPSDHILYQGSMVRGSDGVWRIGVWVAARGVARCM